MPIYAGSSYLMGDLCPHLLEFRFRVRKHGVGRNNTKDPPGVGSRAEFVDCPVAPCLGGSGWHIRERGKHEEVALNSWHVSNPPDTFH